ncbi:DEAD-box ATP-dependent RNA helicase 32 [Carex littledalei]|uniref:ATP-dependent RNA helicase n=1 Tax=Carex littledalei TaxID=544730 RepID=A0A833VP89_9POAL|nr:DEAD-box ATP-dependent RNA helicase 32 [Carex littledalei]
MPRPKLHQTSSRKQRRLHESEEIKLLDEWIDAMKPSSGTNPLAVPPPPPSAPVGSLPGGAGFSPYAGCKLFSQLPISVKTKNGLKGKYVEMSDIQRASLPHSICGRDILGASKTGSGKTLAFTIPVIEKLYRLRWGPEDGVGALIISPTKDLAAQLFEELKRVGKYHTLSAGLLVGGRDVKSEKERVNFLNIIICTPGRLLQHMNETPNFDCSQLQILVLDEADRILDHGFRAEVDAILGELPRVRQTLLFSATQTKSVKDLARVSLNNPEYISVHAEAVTATPERLKQLAMVVPIDQKLDMLWSFIRKHLSCKILVFLTTCKQVKFVFETFSKLRPGVPLKHLHGGMSQTRRIITCSMFAEATPSVLFCTDVASRGLDFPAIDWVVQVDCPEDIETYIHRVGRTARFTNEGRSVLFLSPSEFKMLEKLQGAEPKIPIKSIKPNNDKLEQVSHRLASVLVQYPEMQHTAKRAFVTYLKSIKAQKDKEVFDVTKLPLEDFAKSLGLPVTPKLRFLNRNGKVGSFSESIDDGMGEDGNGHNSSDEELEDDVIVAKELDSTKKKKQELNLTEDSEDDILVPKESNKELPEKKITELPTRISKKKKLKINPLRPAGTRVKFDDDLNILPPLAAIADIDTGESVVDRIKLEERYTKLREEMKEHDKEDKMLQRKMLREKRKKQKMKLKKWRGDAEEVAVGSDEDLSDLDEAEKPRSKKSKMYFNSDSEDEGEKAKKRIGDDADRIRLAEQEALALKLLSSMH